LGRAESGGPPVSYAVSYNSFSPVRKEILLGKWRFLGAAARRERRKIRAEN
jgi:hypothetical protein